MPDDWRIYRGNGSPHGGIDRRPSPPPWRRFGAEEEPEPLAGNHRLGDLARARSYRPDAEVVDKVNAAVYLRRPLLVTGKPGTGKSTLAYNVAHELGLGQVLHWPITSRTTLLHGLYSYDAIGRLHETSLATTTGPPDIGKYIRLGPLGTALIPVDRPRALLIDELDKSDIDLPNDLLHVFEEGQFTIPELRRLPHDSSSVVVYSADEGVGVRIERGVVRCTEFPIIIITSNGERDFPPAFLRRCIKVAIQPPSAEQLADIVDAHLGPDARARSEALITSFLDRRERTDLATDQLLNAVYLATSGSSPPETTFNDLMQTIMSPLDSGSS
jgi:MoxR-like ATPase